MEVLYSKLFQACFVGRIVVEILKHEGRRYFAGWAGLHLFFDSRHPVGESRGAIILLHGYSEHSARYDDIISFFTENGFSVYFFDQRGHGRSEGVRGDVLRFMDYVRDLSTFVDYVREQEPGKKLFVIAHSTGACASVLYASLNRGSIDGLITTGIYLRDAGEYSLLKTILGKALAPLIPLVPIQELRPERIAQNKETQESFRKDPLVYHGAVRVRMGLHFINMEKTLKKALVDIDCPLLVLHGESDQLASPESSRLLYESSVSEDKKIAMLEGIGHEVLHDFGKMETADTILKWITERA
jgi:acylglycerol lipase